MAHFENQQRWKTRHESEESLTYDPETAYDQRKEIYHMSGKIIKTRAAAQTAEGDKSGLWTTVVASAVFLFGEDG